ncbi:MAG TPA: RdgB/HAM1 family non-canonical purine NTP pyrophosphatase [Ginsengibacter sp.]|nr:RdgB/HAM1 family non-canonical purine NTP pyrophosphatase [Ginsengibacter sp.]HRP16365.1 RdgB/HAM1 family non-canonical purine NTP pyrophosphatase [Ginsengibacter sp.]HRP43662.1 RdgB/HAM1 family non-canonical purine NTP pyrophosphatase [Ginsengibacter sp.]
MTELIFATHNENKVREVRPLLDDNFRIMSLTELGLNDDIPEPFDTISENAVEKARTIFVLTGKNCFSEDTGLEVFSLNGEPGVKSARYAGPSHYFEANIDKLLGKLEGKTDRSARFLTFVCLILNGKRHLFEGECKGSITMARRGDKGFGYDSVFIPEGSDKTFGEMEFEEKNKFSHRRKAIDKLISFLQKEHK